ncbi:DUF1194 domain-containing protein [Pseudoroseomonas cervicalis]|uniref:DUF1194 domain-containing protein n=1 Tax=Teichococcus cervicalis TaxID=204525 RepID=UPI0022F14D47|nr:DUF1194 domain-containing protein [Pseudoroseomonas cervicalis]WBV41784.1 DUF1194 domain-containing protein [Pseudoroseomonas cervicalis]
MRRRPLLALPALLLTPPGRAQPVAAAPVDVALVLAIDASGSIGEAEFRLQREGCAEAVTHPAVLAAIRGGPLGRVAIAMVEWGAPGAAETVLGWHAVSDAESAALLAAGLLAAPRSRQSWNAIGDAIDHAAALLADCPHEATRRVIDLSGDGPDMRGRRPAALARDAAVESGITINALAILTGRPDLAEQYRDTVIGGPGAFVQPAEGRADFARALRAKLVREIA